MSLSGVWASPLPVALTGGEDGVFQSEAGDLELSLEQGTRAVTLTAGDVSVSGKANPAFTRIQWSNGSAWTKQSTDRDFAFEQPNLLSDRQVSCVVDRINETVDLWLLSEATERSIIEPPVRKTNEVLKESLQAFMAEDWVTAIATLLDDNKAPEAKTAEIQDIIAKNIRQPLIEQLNGRIDVPVLSEGMEEKLLGVIVEKVLDQIVELSVVGMEQTGFV
jgi:hypothetical protein